MKSYVFPGQGAQYAGMGLDLYEKYPLAYEYFEKANKILGFSISDVMFKGSSEQLKQTKVTQPAIFLYSVILAKILGKSFEPEMVAGHSLGEISALVSIGVMCFEDGLELVHKRALAMQKACEIKDSTMAAVLGLENYVVEEACEKIDGIVVPANYNCPGQLVISGEVSAVKEACILLKNKGAKRTLLLPVGGAFHSPLMESAKDELATTIEKIEFKTSVCPVYQNVTANPVRNPDEIKKNLINQLIAPVKWEQSINQMIKDGGTEFIEVGPNKILQGLIKKINRNVIAQSTYLD